MIVRPLTIHGRREFSTSDHEDWVIRRLIDVCGSSGRGRAVVEEAGMNLFLGFGVNRIEAGEFPSLSARIVHEYAHRDKDLANGIFLTVGADARVYLSTEWNCHPGEEWVIGDLKTQSVAEIYRSDKRRQLVERCNRERWGPRVSSPTARTSRLSRIGGAIMRGDLGQDEIEAIRTRSLESHQLILD